MTLKTGEVIPIEHAELWRPNSKYGDNACLETYTKEDRTLRLFHSTKNHRLTNELQEKTVSQSHSLFLYPNMRKCLANNQTANAQLYN